MAMATKISIALSLAAALLYTPHALAFSPSYTHHASQCRRITTSSSASKLSMSSFFADATPQKAPEDKVQVDSNGKVFTEGAVVEIAPSRSVNAHHVPKPAYGTFDPTTRQFVPQDESNSERKTSCLVLPEGLRGEVKKIYNTNEWDRAHPILVKFNKGEDREGEGAFDIPRVFMMHLDAAEIQVLDA